MEELKNREIVENLPIYKPIYETSTEQQIEQEFLQLKDVNYLDHAGATLYAKTQMAQTFKDFELNFYGNPHSLNPSGKLTSDTIDQVRYKILKHFNTTSDEYTIIFTQSATASLKLVGEYFNYNGGTFVYTQDNHTSVLGMREYAKKFHCILNIDIDKVFELEKLHENHRIEKYDTNSLFVYPAQSNFNGAKYPLSWIEKVHDGCLDKLTGTTNWFCMLDAASYVATNLLDLSKFKPDFVPISFYKLFGYPSGLGALLIKNSSADVLNKRYFGGGTVQISSSTKKFHVFRTNLHESLEAGTIPHLSIISLQHGFDIFSKFNINMPIISKHVFNLAKYVYKTLVMLRHSKGQPVIKFYHDTQFDDIQRQGGIINFNVLRPNGCYVGYSEVLQMANLYKIHLRTGCFCNAGACQYHLKLSEAQIQKNFEAGHICGDQHDLIDGLPTGSVRISFGYMATKREADVFLKMIMECFCVKTPIHDTNGHAKLNENTQIIDHGIIKDKQISGNIIENYDPLIDYKLVNIFIYPIKSCGPCSIEGKWPLSNTGLLYDRQWMIVNHSGVCLTQKQEPKMCLIKPVINLESNLMTLSLLDHPSISISLEQDFTDLKSGAFCQSKVCQDKVQCIDCGDEIAYWLETVLNKLGLRLLQQYSDRVSPKKTKEKTELSLANEAQFLLINLKSIDWLHNVMENKPSDLTVDNLVARFRPNFVITAKEAFEEMSYKDIRIGDHYFQCTGPCGRCQMICIDQGTSEKNAEPLRALAANTGGKMKFGIYLKYENNTNKASLLNIGDRIVVKK